MLLLQGRGLKIIFHREMKKKDKNHKGECEITMLFIYLFIFNERVSSRDGNGVPFLSFLNLPKRTLINEKRCSLGKCPDRYSLRKL